MPQAFIISMPVLLKCAKNIMSLTLTKNLDQQRQLVCLNNPLPSGFLIQTY